MRRALIAILCVISFGQIARAQSLDEQERCAIRSKRAFAEWQAEHRPEAEKLGMKELSSDYQSHFNT